jgi:NAD(P)-dependent dehydrogenase (short-subunit alcohol dehydrogenase family)
MGNEQVAVVTGAGSGIGAAVCARLVDGGLRVLGVDRDEAGLARTAQAVDRPEHFAVHPCDVRHPVAVREAVAHAGAWGGRLDVLVNGAGVLERRQLAETTEEVWSRVIDINLSGTFRMIQAAREYLIDPATVGTKRIVNIGSGAADHGYAYPAYTASKGGVVSLSRELAAEFAPFGVTVNVVNPGFVRTAINADAWADPEARARVEEVIPLGRMGRPDEVAAAVAFLASADAGYITGQVLVVDGGRGAILGGAPPGPTRG